MDRFHTPPAVKQKLLPCLSKVLEFGYELLCINPISHFNQVYAIPVSKNLHTRSQLLCSIDIIFCIDVYC